MSPTRSATADARARERCSSCWPTKSRAQAAVNADLGLGDILDLADGPFDRLAHTADVRRMDSQREDGWYGLNNVGVVVWRLRAYSMTRSPAYLVEERSGDHSFTFS